MQFQVFKEFLDLDAWMHKKASLAAVFFFFSSCFTSICNPLVMTDYLAAV